MKKSGRKRRLCGRKHWEPDPGQSRKRLACAAVIMGLAFTAIGSAFADPVDMPAIPDKPRDLQFEGVSAEWRDYLIEVRAARQIQEPLARCLAWPDLPGHQWPAGHAEAHCSYHFGEAPTPADAAAWVESGEVHTLDARLTAVAAEHGQREDAERIHTFFHDLMEMPADARDSFTARWIEHAPDSAYAAAARGVHFLQLGWRARGNEWASQTSETRFAEMRAHFVEAMRFLHLAIDLDPELTHAYIGLMEIATITSDRKLAAWAVERAERAGPACAEVAVLRMGMLQPRWGGSLQEMERYAASLAPRVSTYPLQANQLVAPLVEAVRIEMTADRYTRQAAEAMDAAVRVASNEDALARAAQLSFDRSDGSAIDDTRGLALLLQRERFARLNPWQARQVASKLVRIEPEWAFATAFDAVAQSPEDSYGQYLLAAASYNVGRFELAEQHYLLARKDPRQAQAALRELVTMWMYDAGLPPDEAIAKAGPYLDDLMRTYPRDGRARLWDWSRRRYLGEGIPQQELVDFVAIADRNDPFLADAIRSAEEALAE